MRVADLMTQDVLAVTPGTALKEAASLLVERGISGLPVCDGDRRVLGVVSEADTVWKTQGYSPERRRFLHWFVDHAGDDQTRLDAGCCRRSCLPRRRTTSASPTPSRSPGRSVVCRSASS
jgi:CBS domain